MWYSCGVTIFDSIVCWGFDGQGQVSGVPKSGKFKWVWSGGSNSCALSFEDIVLCWGDGSHGMIFRCAEFMDEKTYN
eukprot:UN14714